MGCNRCGSHDAASAEGSRLGEFCPSRTQGACHDWPPTERTAANEIDRALVGGATLNTSPCLRIHFSCRELSWCCGYATPRRVFATLIAEMRRAHSRASASSKGYRVACRAWISRSPSRRRVGQVSRRQRQRPCAECDHEATDRRPAVVGAQVAMCARRINRLSFHREEARSRESHSYGDSS